MRVRRYQLQKERRQIRVRRKITGTNKCPRLSVFRSGKHISAQLIDDENAETLASASDLTIKEGTKTAKAMVMGEELAKKALKLKIKKVIFDRGSYKYHGRVEAVAEGARKGGLEF